MRTTLHSLLRAAVVGISVIGTSLVAASLAGAPVAHADPPEVELEPIVITRRAPTVFTTLARSRVDHRREEPRADLVREVAPTVRRAPF